MSFAEIMYFILPLVIASAVPLALVALGALFSERSGVINIALEGIMIMGGFVGAVTILLLEENAHLPIQLVALIGLLVGGIVGIIFSLLHAFAAINMKANQIISATALNMFAPAFAIFTARIVFGTQRVPIDDSYIIHEVPLLSKIPVIGDIFFQGVYLSTLLGVIIFIVAVTILYKT
ncbi:MAG: ABC transporter permease, partial [Candidatus Izimaplasma sp.]|nr:ABC transporter permease [Candidatus Izimaplasma bacterium]